MATATTSPPPSAAATSGPARATLAELAEPFFQHVCYLNRVGREGRGAIAIDAATTEAELEGLLNQIKQQARDARETSAAWNDRVEWALIAFADFAIRESKLPFAGRWKGLGPKRGNLVLDEQFFDDLTKELQGTGPDTVQRLEVYYLCIGLGFQGIHTGDDKGRKELVGLQRRLAVMTGRHAGRGEETDRVCPDAYDHVNTTKLTIDTGRWLVPIAIGLVVMLVGMVVANILTYRQAQNGLVEELARIEERKPELARPMTAAPAPTPTPAPTPAPSN
jgi:type VI protein secretion system component VasF